MGFYALAASHLGYPKNIRGVFATMFVYGFCLDDFLCFLLNVHQWNTFESNNILRLLNNQHVNTEFSVMGRIVTVPANSF